MCVHVCVCGIAIMQIDVYMCTSGLLSVCCVVAAHRRIPPHISIWSCVCVRACVSLRWCQIKYEEELRFDLAGCYSIVHGVCVCVCAAEGVSSAICTNSIIVLGDTLPQLVVVCYLSLSLAIVRVNGL